MNTESGFSQLGNVFVPEVLRSKEWTEGSSSPLDQFWQSQSHITSQVHPLGQKKYMELEQTEFSNFHVVISQKFNWYHWSWDVHDLILICLNNRSLDISTKHSPKKTILTPWYQRFWLQRWISETFYICGSCTWAKNTSEGWCLHVQRSSAWASYQRVIFEEQVLWLQVTMCNIQRVAMCQRLTNLQAEQTSHWDNIWCAQQSLFNSVELSRCVLLLPFHSPNRIWAAWLKKKDKV